MKILKDETGAATAEYAIATIAAIGFAGLLVLILRSDEMKSILFDLIRGALDSFIPDSAAAIEE